MKHNDRVEVFIPKGYAVEDPNVFVSINGVAYLLPRGKRVMVPAAVAAELDRAERARVAWEERGVRLRDMMNDEAFNNFIITTLKEEVIPYIPLPEKEKEDFALSVLERFNNPYIDHRLLDISLNSVSKFKARCLPSLLDNVKNGSFPKRLFFGLACLIEFYNGKFNSDGAFVNERNGVEYEIKDNPEVLEFFNSVNSHSYKISEILKNTDFWGCDLTEIPGASEFVENCCEAIKINGVKAALELL